jgi:hypothetical protein
LLYVSELNTGWLFAKAEVLAPGLQTRVEIYFDFCVSVDG